jgi:hypothetical protein
MWMLYMPNIIVILMNMAQPMMNLNILRLLKEILLPMDPLHGVGGGRGGGRSGGHGRGGLKKMKHRRVGKPYV